MKKDYPIKLAGQLFSKKTYFCSWCKKEVKGFKDSLSAKEFRISGLCQDCQDQTFAESEDLKEESFSS